MSTLRVALVELIDQLDQYLPLLPNRALLDRQDQLGDEQLFEKSLQLLLIFPQ